MSAQTTDASSWYGRWLLYIEAIDSLRYRHPEVLALGMEIVYPSPLRVRLQRAWRDSGRAALKIASFFFGSRTEAALPHPAPVVIAYHQIMTNARGPMELLAARLHSDGIENVLFGPDRPGGTHSCARENANQIADDLDLSYNGPEARSIVYRSFRVGTALAWTLFRRTGFLLVGVWGNPIALWLRVLRTTQRIAAFSRYLQDAGTRVVMVTHERFVPCSELVIAAQLRHLTVVHYHHGFSNMYELPYLATTVCVWNHTDRKMLYDLVGRHSPPAVQITGNAEFDLLHAGADPSADDARNDVLSVRSSGRPIVVVLSQFVHAIPRIVEGTRAMLGLFEAVCTSRPDWFFLFKEHHEGDLLSQTAEYTTLSTMQNVELLPYAESTLPALLRCPVVRIVAAASSTGLYIAAGAGKLAVRVLVEGMDECIPVVDEVSVQIHSATDLFSVLDSNGTTLSSRHPANTDGDPSDPFPFYGKTVEQLSLLIEAAL